jgi:hypothetical protein
MLRACQLAESRCVSLQLNTDEGSLLDGLKDALSQIIDKSSSGGSFPGSAGGLLGMAKKLFQAARHL